MARRRHLRELLGEEQEPFVLQTFLDEKKRTLHNARSRQPPASSTAISKTPSPDRRTTSSLLREAAARIHSDRQNKPTNLMPRKTTEQQQQQKTRPLASSVAGIGLLVFSLLKRFLLKTPRREISPRPRFSVRDVLGWECSPVTETTKHGDDDEINSVSETPCCLRSPEPANAYRSTPELRDEGGENGRPEKREQEEEKDQYSPVSVLDPPFVEDGDGGDGAATGRRQKQARMVVEVHVHDLQQRCRKQPLSKGRGLVEPLDLEKEISRRLIRDLLVEGGEVAAGDVRRWLEGRRDAEKDTIDMMVERDLSRERPRWTGTKEEELREIAEWMEPCILWTLMEELAGELVLL